MILRAYAKINLGLRVLRQRPDRYHDIETIFHQIDLHDDIEIVQTDEGIEFFTESSEVPTDARNLCVRAAQLLRDVSGTHSGVEIKIRKRIPIGAGLGGGSSNAAVVLKALIKLWNLEITKEELLVLAGSLGADVPFFIEGGSAYATGRGERLEPLNVQIPYAILVVTPPVQVSTAWAYSNIRASSEKPAESLRSIVLASLEHPADLSQKLKNDFEAVVFQQYPVVEEAKTKLRDAGAEFALMSGSGSSVFGFFRDVEKAEKSRNELSGTYETSLTKPYFKPDSFLLS